MGSHSLLQGIFPTQGSSPGLLHYRQILYHLSHQRSPLAQFSSVAQSCPTLCDPINCKEIQPVHSKGDQPWVFFGRNAAKHPTMPTPESLSQQRKSTRPGLRNPVSRCKEHFGFPLDCKAIQPVHSKGDQSWVFFGRTDAKAETPILWPPHVKS